MSSMTVTITTAIHLFKKRSALLVLGVFLLFAQQSGQGQASAPPLTFFKNYFVTGNYVSASVDFGSQSGGGGFVTGVINFDDPDEVVPPGADVLGALLYWQTITTTETLLVAEGEQLEFRGNDITNIARRVSVQQLDPNATPCWSGGGGQGATYTMSVHRADVLRFLPREMENGVPVGKRLINDADLTAHGFPLHQVRLPDAGTGNQTPQTAGASLVVIYRVPTESLKAVVVYDGLNIKGPDQLTATQTIRGFYEATNSPAARMTYLVGSGSPNGTEELRFNGVLTATNPFVAVNSPGSDRGWDAPTFDVSGSMSGLASPHFDGRTYGQQVPTSITHGNPSPYDCLATAAIVFSTEVKDTDFDGLLDVWETGDVSGDSSLPLLDPTGQELPDLHAMGANKNVQDIFVELGFMRDADADGYDMPTPLGHVDPHTHLPSQSVLDSAAEVFKKAAPRKNPANPAQQISGPIKVHFDVGGFYPASTNVVPYKHADGTTVCTSASDPECLARGGEEILETEACPVVVAPAQATCAFPGIRGVVGWKPGFRLLRDQPLNYADEEDCQDAGSACHRRFDENRRHMFRYGLFAHAIGVPRANDPLTPVDESKFPRSIGGVSDAGNGGGDFMVTLGFWDNFTASEFIQTSTLVHELGHTMGLRHGGSAPTLLNPAPNCKPNYQSVMNYLFQVRGLIGQNDPLTTLIGQSGPRIDFSRQVLKLVRPGNGPQVLDNLDEANVTETALKQGSAAALYPTRWYARKDLSYLDSIAVLNTTPSTKHCDGTPLHKAVSDPDYNPADLVDMVRVDGTSIGAIDWNANGTFSPGDNISQPYAQDINFNGDGAGTSLDPAADGVFEGWNDWEHLDLRQTASRRNAASLSLEITLEDLADEGDPGYSDEGDPGYADEGDPGYADEGDPGYADEGDPGYSDELDVPLAESQGPTPNSLSYTLTNRSIDTKWEAPFLGAVDKYHVWRSTGPISRTNLPTDLTPGGITPGTICNAVTRAIYCDTSSRNNTTYQYFVTADFKNGNKSGASNIITARR